MTMNRFLPYPTKTISCEVKNIDMNKRLVEGYFSAFDVVDSDGDLIRNGAYAKTIQENGPKGKNRIMHLLQHDPTRPLGKPMELFEDDYGLKFRTMIADTTYGMDALKLYQDGVFKEHSVGINIIKSEFSQEERADIVTEVKMWEGSTVTWGANEMALGSLAKGNTKDLFDRYQVLQKAWYKGDYTDDTFRIIEAQKEHIEGIIKNALVNEEPPIDTPDDQAAKLKAFFEDQKLKNQLSETLCQK